MNRYLLPKIVSRACKLMQTPDFKWTLNRIFPHALFLPHMKPDEFALFKKTVRDKKVILEYGSGGSTIYLLHKGKRLFSVESNPDFFKYMGSVNVLKKTLNRSLTYRFIDLGPTNQWGKPTSIENITSWEGYYSSIWKEINPSKEKVDVVFIDGRFRVCCCLYSLLKILEFGWSDTIFVIHDFWRREKYHILLEFFNLVETASELAVFTFKSKVDVNRVKEVMRIYASATA